MRINRWSNSSFARKLQIKAGIEKPKFATSEGWDEWEAQSKSKAPVTYFTTEVLFDIVQNYVFAIPDAYYAFVKADLWKYFRNLKVFHKALWQYRSWDYSGMMLFMELAAKDMSECHKNHGHLVRSEQTAKELSIFAELMKRVREDNYQNDKVEFIRGKGMFGGSFKQIPNTLPNYNSKAFYKIVASQRREDLKLAAKMFERKSLSWWD